VWIIGKSDTSREVAGGLCVSDSVSTLCGEALDSVKGLIGAFEEARAGRTLPPDFNASNAKYERKKG
jgi:hypothetical protein